MPDVASQFQGTLPFFTTDFNTAAPPGEGLVGQVRVLRSLGVLPERLIAPMFVLLDITSRCNLGCAYCYNRSGCAGSLDMDRDMVLRIAKELVEMKVFSVCVCGGEPTLHPSFLEVIRYLREHGVLVASITNGYDLDEEIIREMAGNVAILQVTLDGPDSATHDALRSSGSFDRAMRTIELLKLHGLFQLRISFTCTSRNIQSFPRMLEFCLEIGADDLRTMPLVPVGRAFQNQDLRPSRDDLQTVKSHIEEWNQDASLAGRISVEWGSPHEHVRIGLAYGYLLGVNVSPEGYYRISPYLPLAFGNAKRISIQKAWELGLGKGWLVPKARDVFEGIQSLEDYEFAYARVVGDPAARDGYVDLFPEKWYGRYGY